MKLKKWMAAFLAGTMILSVTACAAAPAAAPAPAAEQPAAEEKEEAEAAEEATEEVAEAVEEAVEAAETEGGIPKVGFVVYDYSNAFMSYVRKGIENYAQGKLDLEMVDSANDQPKQIDQVNTLLEKGIDILICNLVDSGAGQTVLDACKAKDVPVVFINRAPVLDILGQWDKCWYIGIGWLSPGEVQADLIKAEWEANKDKMDKNGDGVLQYVLVQGNISQQDGIYRTQAIHDAFAAWTEDGSLPAEELDIQEAGWDTTKAKELMETWLVKFGNDIEAVVSNNDAMAMGCIEALRGNGYYDDESRYTYVFGINALPQVQPLLENGELAGTVLTSPWLQAVAAVEICSNVYNGKEPLEGTDFQFSGDTGKEIRVPDSAITKENRNEADDAYNKCQ